ncbi:uncharacterized protein LOC135806349 [Sycon ciliatum]|uniref:uncharacterized protein LOC135806349 n=1 Tax=Sycon ciliatum TaxID=27933 RepID=UPI0031F654DC
MYRLVLSPAFAGVGLVRGCSLIPRENSVLSRQFTCTTPRCDNEEKETISNIVDLTTLDDVVPFTDLPKIKKYRNKRRIFHKQGFMSQVQQFDHEFKEQELRYRLPRVSVDIDHLRAYLHDINAVDVCFVRMPATKQCVEYNVSMVGKSERHCKALGEALAREFKQSFVAEGETVLLTGSAHWYCLDMGNIMVHIFSQEERGRLQLEKLWLLGPEHDDQLRLFNTEFETIIDHFA